MKSVSNGGILKSLLQVLDVPVLLVTPLGTDHMVQSGTDLYESGIVIRETALKLNA